MVNSEGTSRRLLRLYEKQFANSTAVRAFFEGPFQIVNTRAEWKKCSPGPALSSGLLARATQTVGRAKGRHLEAKSQLQIIDRRPPSPLLNPPHPPPAAKLEYNGDW